MESYASYRDSYPDSKFHGANMGPIWGRQDPGGPHVGPMNFAIWVTTRLLGGRKIVIFNSMNQWWGNMFDTGRIKLIQPVNSQFLSDIRDLLY